MSFFKKPAVLIVLSVLLIVGSTLLNGKIGLTREFNKVSEAVCGTILDFAESNNLPELNARTRTVLSHMDSNGKAKMDDLIALYSSYAVGYGQGDTYLVDNAVREYTRFFTKADRLPASFFVSVLNLF